MIEIHVCTSRRTFDYYGYLVQNFISLAENKSDLKFVAHVIGLGTPSEKNYRVDVVCNVREGSGSSAHADCIKSAINFCEENVDIKVIADSDVVMLHKNWDTKTKQILENFDCIGTAYEDIGGFSSGNVAVQTFKKFPNFTWNAYTPKRVSFKGFDPYPLKHTHLQINDETLSSTYNLPVGYSLLRDACWSFPQFCKDKGINCDYLRQTKPTKNAKIITTENDYHEEYQLSDGIPFVAHQRGSMKHEFRRSAISSIFYDVVDKHVLSLSLENDNARRHVRYIRRCNRL